jgi:hypothetical protein
MRSLIFRLPALALFIATTPAILLVTYISRRSRPEPELVECVLLPPTSPWKEC